MYLAHISSPATPEHAKEKWSNLNTYLALLAKDSDAQKLPVLAHKATLSLVALSTAFEFSPETRSGRNSELRVPAAAQWLRIAGDQIESLCANGTERMPAGDLWTSTGGGEICDKARLQFWKTRMAELGY
jgi:hypothetical protein